MEGSCIPRIVSFKEAHSYSVRPNAQQSIVGMSTGNVEQLTLRAPLRRLPPYSHLRPSVRDILHKVRRSIRPIVRPLKLVVLQHIRQHDLQIRRSKEPARASMRANAEAQRLQRGGYELRRVLFAGLLALLEVAVWLPLVRVGIVLGVPHAGHVGCDHGAFGDEGVVWEGDVFEGVAVREN